MSEETVEQIAVRAQQGDQEAITELWERVKKLVFQLKADGMYLTKLNIWRHSENLSLCSPKREKVCIQRQKCVHTKMRKVCTQKTGARYS